MIDFRKLSQTKKTYLASWLSAAFGFFLTIYLFRPGFMTPDPTSQLAEARSGLYTDLHPPIMAFLWHYLDFLTPGPLGMLIFHNLMLWSALALLATLLFSKSLQACLFIFLFGFFPPVFCLLGMIWKDVGMGASLLLGCALLLFSQMKKSKKAMALSLAFFFYGYSVRPNSLPALIPLLFWVGLVIQQFIPPLQKRPFINSGIFACSIAALFILMNHLINSSLINGRQHYQYQEVLIYDLAGISAALGTNEFPSYINELNPGLTPEFIQSHYSKIDFGPLLFSNVVLEVDQPEKIELLFKRWFEAIRSHKRIYLKHRLNHFMSLLSLGRYTPETYAFRLRVDERAPPIVYSKFHDRFLKKVEEKCNELVLTTVLFSSGTYVLLVTFLLGLSVLFSISFHSFTRVLPALCVGASGLLYSSAYLLIGLGSNFRYTWWTELTGIFMIPLLLKSIRASLLEPSSSNPITRNRKVVAATFILRNDGSCLLQHRDNKPGLRHAGKWTIPGGHQDQGETLEQCAIREVEEETGYKCDNLKHLNTFEHDDGDGEKYQISLFWTKYDGIQTYQCHEGQAVRFVSRCEVENLPFLQFLLPFWDKAIQNLE